ALPSRSPQAHLGWTRSVRHRARSSRHPHTSRSDRQTQTRRTHDPHRTPNVIRRPHPLRASCAGSAGMDGCRCCASPGRVPWRKRADDGESHNTEGTESMSAERMSTTRGVAERTATSNGMARFGDLAERVGTTARVETVFGEPVERDGVTVIPVARARWGFGGGTGARSGEEGEGAGGGTVV